MDAVSAAFAAVPRAGFLLDRDRARADLDAPVPIGHGQTNSQPRTVAAMLRLLAVEPGHRVLDVGAGSGWTTALLAELTGPGGTVIGVELVPELVELGTANLGRTSHPWASIRPAAPDVLGWPTGAPYDRILVSADAPALPEELLEQLGDESRMVVPVRSTMTLAVRTGRRLRVSEHGGYRFVPLIGGRGFQESL